MPIKILCSILPGMRACHIASFRCVIQSMTKTGSCLSKSLVSVKSTKGPSPSVLRVILPSSTNSDSAGTSRSLVTHFTSFVSSSALAMANSSTPDGGPKEAATMTGTELPTHIAISTSPWTLSYVVRVCLLGMRRAVQVFLLICIIRW